MLLKPGDEVLPKWILFYGLDKLIHFSIFAFLAFCFLCAFPKIKFWTFFQIILAYAFLTEILQEEMNFGRKAEWGDIIADLIGYLIGFLVYRVAVTTVFPWLRNKGILKSQE